MVPDSPVDALGSHAPEVRSVLVDVARFRHDRSAEAHQISESQFSIAFASQWRDLLVEAHSALHARGYQTHRLLPAGYRLPVVNECLVYLWRVPGTPHAVNRFASSPTRKNGFTASPPPAMLPHLFADGVEQSDTSSDDSSLHRTLMALGTMPMVLVLVHSSPWKLRSIEWAIATLDDANNVALLGQETIWEPEVVADEGTPSVDAFDSGTPSVAIVEVRKEAQSDA